MNRCPYCGLERHDYSLCYCAQSLQNIYQKHQYQKHQYQQHQQSIENQLIQSLSRTFTKHKANQSNQKEEQPNKLLLLEDV